MTSTLTTNSISEKTSTHIKPLKETSPDNTGNTPKYWALILILYLAGIAMGALDTGIVNPARTIIQNDLGVSEQTGVWIFTIYTLAYAAGIPIIGKIADVMGRKPVYILAITLFGLGSLGCGLAQNLESFPTLLTFRVIQAIGGGGMMPVATAAIGTIVPPAKRGMALGLVGMVYGVASVFGGSAGSLILDIAGIHNWQWIFYINVPIAIAVIAIGLWALPKENTKRNDKLDLIGIAILVTIITCILWSFQNLDFVNITSSIKNPNVWQPILASLVLSPVFWKWEQHITTHGKDPIINFTYFTSFALGATLLLGAVSGMLMMSGMFIPQFAENSMRLPAGAGGYPTIILGIASAIGAPISGKLTDKHGPRFVLGIGVLTSAVAGLMLIFWASPYPGLWSAAISIFVMGLGLGFLMGAPLTYLILHLVPARDANSGQAALSLIRSMGTVLAPAILVGLLSTAMGSIGIRVMNSLPEFPSFPTSSNTQIAPKFLSEPGKTPNNSNSENPSNLNTDAHTSALNMELPPQIQQRIQTADVTNITERCKEIANYLFDQQAEKIETATGALPPDFEQTRLNYLAEIDANSKDIESTFQLTLNEGFARLFWFYTLISLAGILLLLAIPSKKTIDRAISQNLPVD